MHLSSILPIFLATVAFAAPQAIVERATCSTAEKFTNGAFNGTSKEWYLTREYGTGKVTAGVQTKYYPTAFPAYGGPQAYNINFTIPANQTKGIRLEQKIASLIKDGGGYTMSFNALVLGTSSASCTAAYYAGSDFFFQSMSRMPSPQPAPAKPSDANWFFGSMTVAGNNQNGQYNVAGSEFSCSAGAQAATVAIYLDNASLVEKC